MNRFAARWRDFMQAETVALLKTELLALRTEMQADRLAFNHALEQLRQAHEQQLHDQRVQLQELRKVYDDLDMRRLVDAIDGALMTLALEKK